MGSRRQQLTHIYNILINELGDDIGRPLVAHIDAIAWQLDETDDLRSARLVAELAEDTPNRDYYMPDTG